MGIAIESHKELIYTPTVFEVVANYSFDEKDKNLEIEWIDEQLAFYQQKLVAGAATLQRSTIARLMDLVSQLTIKKEFLEGGSSVLEIESSNTKESSPAWQLHKKSQSGFEQKTD